MNVGSLFSGIGGMDYGLAAAGHRHVFFCEGGGDPSGTDAEREQWKQGVYRRAVLAARWPGVPIYDDVRSVHATPDIAEGRDGRGGLRRTSGSRCAARADGEQGAVDLLCGGFPCQDLSVAGKRAGLAGNRSGLFFEFARIIAAFRPGWVLVENVPGLLSSNGGRDFGVVLATLADLGYGVGWRILDSRFFGVPQRRRRVFIVGAVADGDSRAASERAGEILAVGARCPRHPATRGEAREDVAVASLSGLGSGGPDEHPRPGSNSNGQVVSFHMTQDPISGDEVCAIGRKSGGQGVMDAVGVVRRLTPRECERLQGLPDDWTQLGDTPDSRRYSALGDAVTATVAEWIGRRLEAAA